MLYFNNVKWALFKGIEQEGPLRGRDTLFVVGDAPLDKILSALQANKLVSIYFGAGHRSEINLGTVEDLLKTKYTKEYLVNMTLEGNDISADYFHMLLSEYEEYISIYLMLPIIWHGIMDLANVRTMHKLVGSPFASYVLVKFDIHEKTFVCSLPYVNTSEYKDYSADELLEQVER